MEWPHRVFTLDGMVQHYSWGGYEFIPRLLNLENKEHKAFAEYWLGAHPNHPSTLEGKIPLNEFISKAEGKILGETVAQKFSSLPYLLKVLDVRQMLSIQVHPSKEMAEKGFAEEEKKGIPVTAPNRNYKDRNHKPELMVALGDFWLLHGFKEEKKLLETLSAKRGFQFLIDVFQQKGYKGLYEAVMTMPQKEVNSILSAVVNELLPQFEKGSLKKNTEDYWAAKAVLNFCKDDEYDRGIFSIYFFNLVQLKAGEGIYQGSGLPHAYLEGQNVEIMANSDNVLRAGLTDKHIDVNELLKHVKFEPTIPNILKPSGGTTVYTSPAEEFQLCSYRFRKEEEVSFHSTSAEIFLLIEGKVKVMEQGRSSDYEKGSAFFVMGETDLLVKAASDTLLFRVTVPVE